MSTPLEVLQEAYETPARGRFPTSSRDSEVLDLFVDLDQYYFGVMGRIWGFLTHGRIDWEKLVPKHDLRTRMESYIENASERELAEKVKTYLQLLDVTDHLIELALACRTPEENSASRDVDNGKD